MPSSLLQPDRPANSRRAKGARSDSCKLGCEYEMTILQLAQWPWVTRIRLHAITHNICSVPVSGMLCILALLVDILQLIAFTLAFAVLAGLIYLCYLMTHCSCLHHILTAIILR